MITKSRLPGVKVFKSFKDFIKDLSQSLEKEHHLVHNEHKRQVKELSKKAVTKGSQ